MKMKDINNKQAGAVFNAISAGLQKEGDRLIIPNFGTFSVIRSKERKGSNPHTGEAITIPSKLSVKFKQSIQYKKEIN